MAARLMVKQFDGQSSAADGRHMILSLTHTDREIDREGEREGDRDRVERARERERVEIER